MLFHGTSKANLLAILEQGLQVAPKNSASIQGAAFGRGIYFSDNFNMASQYADSSEDQKFLLVCEVALGNVMNSLLFNEKADERGFFKDGRDFTKGYHSVRVMGSHGPDFSHNWVEKDTQVVWPIGPRIEYESP